MTDWPVTSLDAQPYYVVADNGTDKGYLKVNPGSTLQTSHFDVGGEVVVEGLKGRIYGGGSGQATQVGRGVRS